MVLLHPVLRVFLVCGVLFLVAFCRGVCVISVLVSVSSGADEMIAVTC